MEAIATSQQANVITTEAIAIWKEAICYWDGGQR